MADHPYTPTITSPITGTSLYGNAIIRFTFDVIQWDGGGQWETPIIWDDVPANYVWDMHYMSSSMDTWQTDAIDHAGVPMTNYPGSANNVFQWNAFGLVTDWAKIRLRAKRASGAGVEQYGAWVESGIFSIGQEITITSNAQITYAAGVDPNRFSFSTAIAGRTSADYQEPQLKHVCDHSLSSGAYSINACPRCLGSGIYYDIKIDELGRIPQVHRDTKLMQDIEKITLTALGDNKFHDRYGSLVSNIYGTAVSENTRTIRLKQSIIDAVMRIKSLQLLVMGNNAGNFGPSELIQRIDKIEVFNYVNDPRSVGYTVYIVTLSGETKLVEGTIIIS